MKVIGVCGPDEAGRSDLVEALADRLTERGRVMRVRSESSDGSVEETDEPTVSSTETVPTYTLREDGWAVHGDARSLDDVIDALAPRYEFVVVENVPDADVPQVVLGDEEPSGEVLLTAPDATALEVDAIVDAIDDVEPTETLESLVATAKASPDADKAGAIATFTGRVRAREHDDDVRTEYLEFERYDEVAERTLATIREELAARDGVYEVCMHHRTGVVEYGEDIVFVVVLAGHREEAFETVEDGIDRLKAEVPLFKKEVTVEDEFWAHE